MLLIPNCKKIIEQLLEKEDTIGDKKITILDKGPKVFTLNKIDNTPITLKGNYLLSNLLQEIAIEMSLGNSKNTTISLDRIFEKPTNRISRLIKDYYWKDLTRTLDKDGLNKVLEDEKINDMSSILYIPFNDNLSFKYFKELKLNKKFKVIRLPKEITPNYVLSLNNKPGILSLALYKDKLKNIKGYPFVVPGGRFNEMYGWDSYFQSIGLLIDHKPELVLGTLENFRYEVEHYGSILNANRSYYLTRSNPPFYSSLLISYIEKQKIKDITWIAKHLETIIKEYETVWLSKDRQCKNGLSRYYGKGIGYPIETETGHFKEITNEYAKKYNLSAEDFEAKYLKREIECPSLDDFFIHDRSLRESGHDTTSRLFKKSANLNTVDLNALLYKYETDIEHLIKNYFNASFTTKTGKIHTPEKWNALKKKRKKKIVALMWDQAKGSFFDYNFISQTKVQYIAPTIFYTMWANLCSFSQAKTLVYKILPKLKYKGGIVSCSKESKGNNPKRQWDYPYGWAPHQMIVWKGLLNYNNEKQTQELVYRWLWLLTKTAVDFNGALFEKYDVVNCTHLVDAEYGNQGTNFEYIPNGGFGWMNASYQYGLSLLKENLRNKLDNLVDPDIIFNQTNL